MKVMDKATAENLTFSVAREEYEDTIAKGVNTLVILSHAQSVNAGWYSDIATGESIKRNVPEMIALIHSEISEALEGFRKNKMDDHIPEIENVAVELADALIRIGDLAYYLDIDLGNTIVDKMNYNLNRADHKIENRAKEGGKAF